MDQNIHFPSIASEQLNKVHTRGIDYKKLGSKINSGFHLYTQLNSKIPDITVMQEIDKKKLFTELIAHYKPNPLNVLSEEEYDENTGDMELKRWMIFLKKDLLICYSEEGVNLLYDNETPENESQEWITLLYSLVKTSEGEMKEEGKMNILAQDMYANLSLKSFTVPKPALDIDLHYNDDFHPIHDYILKRLQTPNDTGLVLLHGLPGTGKTTYLRYLSFILNKKLIYVPPAIASNLSSLNFVTFMIDYPNSILIIEDAENILVDEGIRTFPVSSLLNVADGLLSDCLNLQVICTFNTDLRRIDKALLRKGRLIALYEFKKLTIEKTMDLAKSLGMNKFPENPAILADIFSMQDPDYRFEKKNKIGFNRKP
jgi:hypothetical protein